VTNLKEQEKLRLKRLNIALNGRFYITNDFYLPIRVCMKDIKDTSVDRNVKWIHSYSDGEIIVDITENDFIVDRDKIGILTALKEEFNFIDWEVLGYNSKDELFEELEEFGINTSMFADLKKYIDKMKLALVEFYVEGVKRICRLNTDEEMEDMGFNTEDLIELQSCFEYMHRPYYSENHNKCYDDYSIREKILQKTFLTKKNLIDAKLQMAGKMNIGL